MIKRVQGGWKVSYTGEVYCNRLEAEKEDAANAPKPKARATRQTKSTQE